MKLYKIIPTLIFIFCFIIQMTIPTITSASDDIPIKVGFIQGDGFHTMEVNGGFSGYNYDYLMKVAQYTGWTYEFIVIEDNGSLSADEIAQNMIQNGDLDLLGSMYKTQDNEIFFEFGEKNYGVSRHILCALGNNNKITANSFFLQDEISVALVEGREASINAFENIFEHSNVELNITYVDSNEEALALLIDEQVDTIMSTDVSANSNVLVCLTESTPTPFYFVSTKGNSKLLEELDEAIKNIELNEFTILKQSLDEYFSILHTGNIILTQEEENALKDYPYLTVGLLKGREPYQFYVDGSDETPKGISVEILEEISNIIGVEFKYVWLEDREEMREKIASQEIDLCSTVPFDPDYQLTYFFDVIVTQPYLTNAVAWLHSSTESKNADPLYYYIADNIPFYPDDELTEIFDLENSILDLSYSNNTSIFADPYMAQYVLQKLGLSNVEIQTVTSMSSKICFGVGKHLDSVVVGLLNHAILHLDPYVVDEIIYRNVTVQSDMSLKALLREHALLIIFIIVCLFSLITFTLVYYTKKFQNLSRQDSLTKLYNAGYFHNYATEKTKKINNGCLILVDIDYFKQVNDNHGHQMGDKIIIAVARQLQQIYSQYGTVARLGGDEFVILVDKKHELVFFNERCTKILENLLYNETGVQVTLSMGGYIFNTQTTYDNLYRLADEVLYKVKEKGRNSYLFSSDDVKEND